ncbi:Coenzyme PQQ synthesis protein D (PqqD) [Seinonella peptonophila]|uniref:Coenzyme PQQ synthesis protein D (PqqD) n=1 Tax=Seinonella peptonophila TaxID=112248 RepID=A0A1M5AXM5_9BACL|nr:PqqD family protein [Seinonella peptonophila]SHF34662.1 Coenzyme PQQ synthesis protein D (PqqD) [Seinonella peptonophila]
MKYQVAKEAFFSEIDEGAFIYHSQTEICFGLDEVGLKIWQLIEQGKELEKIIESINLEYQEDRLQVEKDIIRFVNQLTEHDLVIMNK